MRVSLKWLADYVDVTLPPKELAHKLTMAGLEVEHIERIGGDWDEQLVTVGLVLSIDAHPNADKLRLATVEYGTGEPLTVVCGAPNVAVGQKIAFARAGAKLIDGHTSKPTELKAAKIRGVESAGMVCSERELGLSEEHEGILVLSDDAVIGTPLAQHLGDVVLHVDLKPNRADCLSMIGVAREVAALTEQTLRMPEHTYDEMDEPASNKIAVEIADPDLCYRYVASVIEGVKVGPSPQWLQERLIVGGMRPINNVVDVTNYVMLEIGQPLHPFDYEKIGGQKIIVRRAGEKEKMRTLDGIEHELTTDTLVIADEKVPVALAGVMGGFDSEVTDGTTIVLLESATFHPINIRKTATRLKARSEASARFEKVLHPDQAWAAAQRATKLLVEIAGGKAYHGFVEAYPEAWHEAHLEVTRQRLQQVLGIDLPTSTVRHALTALGFSCQWEPPDTYHVRVPYWRTDVRIPDDIAEEVARIVGYDEIPTKGLGGQIPPSIIEPRRALRERLKDAFVAAGMQEVITYSMTTMEALKQVVPPEDLATYPPLRVVNPQSSDYEYLRPVLRANLLRALATNVRQHDGEIALFEAARVYLTEPSGRPTEQEHIVGVVGGQREDRWGRGSGEAVDFYDAKGYVETALDAIDAKAAFGDASLFGMLSGRAAEMTIDGRVVGSIGQVHPKVAAAFDIEADAFLFELVLDELLPFVGGVRRAEPIVRFPAVVEDLALVVAKTVSAEQVHLMIEQHALVRSAQVFDVYEGERIGADKKSLAFSVTYQSADHTLDDKEVAKARSAIVARLKNELNAELRG